MRTFKKALRFFLLIVSIVAICTCVVKLGRKIDDDKNKFTVQVDAVHIDNKKTLTGYSPIFSYKYNGESYVSKAVDIYSSIVIKQKFYGKRNWKIYIDPDNPSKCIVDKTNENSIAEVAASEYEAATKTNQTSKEEKR